VDFKRKGVEEVNRASVHVYNLEEEIDGFAECVALIASEREGG
jgi:selenocysteine lyase/cysteine desulfurase